MAETKMVAMWKGRPATELTHEELLRAYEYACRMIAMERECHQQTLEMLAVNLVP